MELDKEQSERLSLLTEALINPRPEVFRRTLLKGGQIEGAVILGCVQGATQMKRSEDC